ncbi:MAG: copper amine oxidase N-terminal domain-containing protein [Paenibacillus sp.]|nr:copper amine oxidase N-terminal domain-containing protein [Paenibacillus sp.]
MKRVLSVIAVAMLALILSVPVFAAQKPIDVFINGTKVSFNTGAPYLEKDSVLVPFRAVFEKLGLQVLWDAKTGTVTGTGSGLKIQLKIGSNRASVNGIVKKLSTAPLTSAGTTYIPLRFIGEATGGKVLWEPAARSVRITTTPSKAADEAEITGLFNNMIKYMNEENALGMNSIIDPESYFSEYVSSLGSTFATFDIKNILNNLNIMSIEGNEAVVTTSETSLRISGPYFPDEEYKYIYTLIRKDNSWKISDVKEQESTILLSYTQALKPADALQQDKTSINNTLSSYYKALNDENLNEVLATMASVGEEEDAQLSSDFEQYFSNNNVRYTPGISNIFYMNGNEAAVYTEHKMKETKEVDTYEQGIIFVFSKSSDGTWKISQSYTVFDALSHS